MSCPRILQDGDDILLEFRGWDPAEKPEESFFWGRLQRTLFFSAQTVNAVDLKLKLGHIPENLILKAEDPEKDCLSSRIQKDYLVQLADTCLGRETQLVLGPSYTYRKPWRIFSMPVMIPLAIAADIALIPVYTGYWIKCVTVGCAK